LNKLSLAAAAANLSLEAATANEDARISAGGATPFGANSGVLAASKGFADFFLEE
jgi:hypothetical protein